MPEISLTDFVDFIVKAGTPKLTKIRQLKERGMYEPATDFWKPLREAIIEFHRKENQDKNQLDRILTGLTDPKKRNRYPGAIEGYKKFLGKKKIRWADPFRSSWSEAGLDVRINPELGLIIPDQHYLIKLYFKDEKLEKRKIDVILALMEETLRPNIAPLSKIAILDISSNTLFESPGSRPDLMPLLVGEAAAFVTMWNRT